MKLTKTERGFTYGEFIDRYGHKCSVQKSSLAFEDCIWLGLDEGTHADGTCCARMHLTKKMVKDLLPKLQKFVETGELD